MRIKRFEARDLSSAMALVKEALGEEAVILSTRTVKAPAGKRSLVEIVAAMEYDREPVTIPPPEPPSPAPRRPAPQGRAAFAPRLDAAGPAVPDPAAEEEVDIPLPGAAASLSAHAGPVRLEASDLRRRLAGFLQRRYCPSPESRDNERTDPPSPPSRPDPRQVAQWREKVIGQLRVASLSVSRNGGPTILALVGPTGVGKTTTAAKIAAWYSIHECLRVALVSMDCYRIGATDQLRTYARIMRLPCEVVLRSKDLAAALARHRDKDLIIIDTAGKSPYDPEHVRELAAWFTASPEIKTQLVVSATCKKEDLQHLLRVYDPLGVSGLVLTKLDETRAYAALCQELAGATLPISCLCTGQRVPEDFLPASREFLQALFGQGWQAALQEMQNSPAGGWTQ